MMRKLIWGLLYLYFIESFCLGVNYSYLEDIITDAPPAPTAGMALLENRFPRISLSETNPVPIGATRLAKYDLVVFRGNAPRVRLIEDTKAINPNIVALKYTHPVEYIANSKAPQEFPFTGTGPKTNGSGKVYAGHWLYLPGKRTTASMTASSNSVTVNNSSGLNAGRYVVIYDPPLGSFNNAEHAKIGSKNGNTINFSIRGYKSTAKSHTNNAIIALHDKGQGGAEENWRYNMSTACPLDGNGKQINEVIANWHADNLLLDGYPTGTPRPDLVDGIEFDADQNAVPAVDVNNNLQKDDGYIGGENVWVSGMEVFYQTLRNRHPSKYIIGGAHNTLGFDFLNGNQLESWPSGGSFQNSPGYSNMDGYLSRAQFQLRYRKISPIYMECLSKTPSPSYPDPQPKGNGPPNHRAHRFHFGLALLDDGFYVEARHDNGPGANNYPNGQDLWYDEYSVNVTVPVGHANFGKSIHGKTGNQTQLRNHSNWLGTALGPRYRIYDNTFAPANSMINNGSFNANKNGWISTNVTLSRVTSGTFEGAGSLKASKMNNFKDSAFGALIKSPTFSVTNGKEYTICWALRASEIREFNAKVGGQLNDQPKFNAGPAWVRYVMTFKATSTKSNERLSIGVGGHDTEVWVDEVYMFEGNANVFRRDFQNGIVVVNATHKNKTIQLGETFKRITGHLDATNNGAEMSAITLPKFDSAVLVRMSGAPPSPLAAPSNLAAVAVSDTQVDLSWVDESGDETNFELERKIGTGSYMLIATLDPDTESFSDTNLTAATEYTYRIRAINGAGASTYSNIASATTASAPPPTIPNAPSNLVAVAVTPNRIDLTWVDESDNEESFKLQRKVGTGTFSFLGTVQPNVESFSDTGLTEGTLYTYRLRARNTAYQFSAFSNTASATTLTSNVAPTLSPVANQSTDETCITVTHIVATDPDTEDVLTLSADNLPSFASLQDNGDGTGLLVIKPGDTDAGEYTITLIVSDGINGDVSTQFTLTVVDT